MTEYRITKYNPKNRNSQGHYLLDEWTEFCDVGTLVKLDEYEKIENGYIQAACEFAKTWDSAISLSGLEDHSNNTKLKSGQIVTLDDLPAILRSILRNEFWCRIESSEGFIHFGYDYYMYTSTTVIGENMISEIHGNGLFVEKMISPHKIK